MPGLWVSGGGTWDTSPTLPVSVGQWDLTLSVEGGVPSAGASGKGCRAWGAGMSLTGHQPGSAEVAGTGMTSAVGPPQPVAACCAPGAG